MEKKELKAEILFRLEDYNGSRKEAERLLRQYAQSVRKEMFTKEELEHLMEIELDYQEKMRDPFEKEPLDERLIEKLEKLTELLNLEEKGK